MEKISELLLWRILQRRLTYLVESGQLIAHGERRGRCYSLGKLATTPSEESTYISISIEAQQGKYDSLWVYYSAYLAPGYNKNIFFDLIRLLNRSNEITYSVFMFRQEAIHSSLSIGTNINCCAALDTNYMLIRF